jgi:alpha-amylase
MTRETMIPVCLYFQVHQPWRLRRYNYFDVGREHRYFDDAGNREIFRRVADRCYLPATAMLERILERHDRFRVAFSVSGCLVEQAAEFAPEIRERFRRLAATGRVEFLAETSHHSLAWLASRAEFTAQVALHLRQIVETFGVEPRFETPS